MAKRLELAASERGMARKKEKRLPSKAVVPANLFGRTQQSVSLLVSRSDLQELVDHRGSITVLLLKVGDQAAIQVMMRHLEHNPISGEIVHVDFYQTAPAH